MEHAITVAEDRLAADAVLANGTVRTLDPSGTRTEAVAVRDGRFLAVGTSRSIAELTVDHTQLIDLCGRTVLLGFVESHSHPTFFGLILATQVDAGNPPNETIADVFDWVAEAARGEPVGEWVRGYRYDDMLLAERRHRIEHCQTVRADQLDRMAEHEVLASLFIKHVYYWGDRHRDVFLDAERARRISPLASARARGVRFGLHSDAPGTPVPALDGVWCAVACTTRGGESLGPEQSVDIDTALRGYTLEAAYLAGEENHKGSIEPGKFADFAVLSRDPTRVPTDELLSLSVEATLVGGEVVFRADTAAGAFPGGAR